MHTLLLDMAYHSQGAFDHNMLYEMPLPWRKFYMHKLIEIKEKEADQAKKAQKGSNTSSPRRPPNMPSRR